MYNIIKNTVVGCIFLFVTIVIYWIFAIVCGELAECLIGFDYNLKIIIPICFILLLISSYFIGKLTLENIDLEKGIYHIEDK